MKNDFDGVRKDMVDFAAGGKRKGSKK